MMSFICKSFKYTESHEWVKIAEDGTVTVGITDYAQDSLGDIVFIELPEVGIELSQNDPVGVVESVKAASDIYAPISGQVVAINQNLIDHPDYVNNSPYEEGWMFVMKPTNPSELDQLLSSGAYEKNMLN